jgi:chemotaxis response regulator CheB
MCQYFTIGVGSSAGGLRALCEFFGNIRRDIAATFIVISHLPKDFPTQLDHVLAKETSMPVRLLSEDIVPQAGHIYVLPGKFAVTISGGKLILRQRSLSEKINLVIDEFFFSLARERKERAVAVVLSGMSSDGAQGAKAVHDEGGIVLVQHPDTTEHNVMPGSTIRADDPHTIAAPKDLAYLLTKLIVQDTAAL